jgi:hypothetical protein
MDGGSKLACATIGCPDSNARASARPNSALQRISAAEEQKLKRVVAFGIDVLAFGTTCLGNLDHAILHDFAAWKKGSKATCSAPQCGGCVASAILFRVRVRAGETRGR